MRKQKNPVYNKVKNVICVRSSSYCALYPIDRDYVSTKYKGKTDGIRLVLKRKKRESYKSYIQ